MQRNKFGDLFREVADNVHAAYRHASFDSSVIEVSCCYSVSLAPAVYCLLSDCSPRQPLWAAVCSNISHMGICSLRFARLGTSSIKTCPCFVASRLGVGCLRAAHDTWPHCWQPKICSQVHLDMTTWLTQRASVSILWLSSWPLWRGVVCVVQGSSTSWA